MTNVRLSALALLTLLGVSACSGGEGGDAENGSASTLSGAVQVDGSSTVAPISEAAAEEFQLEHPDVRVTVGIAGTGGGFQRFCSGETDISNASRPISDEEKEACAAAEIEYLELPVAWDGLSVVVNPANDFLECLTVEELRRIWQPNSRVTTWRDVRSEFPAQPIKLYGAGTDSGTFDYFTDVIVGETGSSRTDYQASEDDNVLVQGVGGDQYALGYFGHAYATQNADKVKTVAVDNGAGCVMPTDETIENNSYAPLSRELFIYVARGALSRAEVTEFVRFYMENAATLVPSTGYLALGAEEYQQNLSALDAGAGPDGSPAPEAPEDSAAGPGQ